MRTKRQTSRCSKRSPSGATATRRWSGSIRPTGSRSTFPAARICSAARRRWRTIWCGGWAAPRPAGARRDRRYGRMRVGCGAVFSIPPPTGEGGRRSRPGGDRSFWRMNEIVIAPLPLAALRLPAETIEALSQVGLKRIADVLDRPRAPLAARFGAEFVRRLDQALGREDEPIAPRLPDSGGDHRAALRRADRARARRARHHREACRKTRRIAGAARRRRAAVAGRAVPHRWQGVSHRGRHQRAAARAGAHPPSVRRPAWRDRRRGRSGLRLRHAAPCGTGHRAMRTGADRPRQPDHAAELAHLIDRLGARFGLRRVTRFVRAGHAYSGVRGDGDGGYVTLPLEGRVDRRSAAKAVGWGSIGEPRFDPPPQPSPARGEGARGLATVQDSLAPTRPIRLLARPEPVEAIAEVPDGPPVRFRWRHVLHEVVHVEGPERIAMEWWRDEAGHTLMRDYFRVESREGLRVWLFRAWPKPQKRDERRAGSSSSRHAGSCMACSHEQCRSAS